MNLQNCKEIIFHFNKAHLADQRIPAWVVKTKGQTYYVEHVECNAPWTTKETPDSPHTKGSIKLKHVDLSISDGLAIVTETKGGESQ